MIGKHQPREAKGLDDKGLIGAMLEEAFTALDESIHALTDEQFWAFPMDNRHNIVSLVEHCLQCLDMYALESQGHELTFESEERFDIWRCTPEQLRPCMKDLPTVEQERERIAAVREAVLGFLQEIPAERLSETCPGWFGEETGKNRRDACWRATAHTHAHVRQIWLKRGLMGLTDTTGWPEQHWA